MTREGKLAKNTFILAIGTVLPKLAVFISLPILTANLSKEEFGYYDLIILLGSLLLPTVTLRIETAAFRFLIDCRHDKSRIRTIVSSVLVFILPVSVVSLVVLCFLLPENQIIKFLICLYYLIDIYVKTIGQIARGLEFNLDFSVSAIISAIGAVIFVFVLVQLLEGGFAAAIFSLLIASTLSLIVLLYKTRIYSYLDLRRVGKSELKELLSYSWPMVPNSMSMWFIHVADRFIVTMFLGLSANAVYAVANKIPAIITVLQQTFTMAWQENASMVSKDSDADAYYSSVFKIIFNLIAGILSLIICATPLLFMLLIRGNYADAFFHMPLLFLAMFFYSLCAFMGGIYVAYKDTKSVGVTTTVTALFKLVLCLSTIKWLGLFAASGSTMLSYLLLLIYRMMDVRKLVKIEYDIKHIIIVTSVLVLESFLCMQQSLILNITNCILGIAVFIVLNKSVFIIMYQKIIKLIRNGRYGAWRKN